MFNIFSFLGQNISSQTLTPNTELFDAYKQNDIDKMKQLKNKFRMTLPNSGYYIDEATENGNEEMVKFLVSEFNAKPSLYAKQMATIHGHNNLVDWLNTHSKERNDTGISAVHRHYNKSTGKFEWNDCIPVEHRKI